MGTKTPPYNYRDRNSLYIILRLKPKSQNSNNKSQYEIRNQKSKIKNQKVRPSSVLGPF
jgi:hypothetical protein